MEQETIGGICFLIAMVSLFCFVFFISYQEDGEVNDEECMKILEDKCENGNCKLGMIEEDKEIYCCEQSGRLYIGRAYLEIS